MYGVTRMLTHCNTRIWLKNGPEYGYLFISAADIHFLEINFLFTFGNKNSYRGQQYVEKTNQFMN
jgi:hypothetical protein